MSADDQDQWVRRVLGVDAAAAPVPAHAQDPPSMVWRTAKAAVDARSSALQRSLRAEGDEELDLIAEKGVFAVTSGRTVVPFVAAIAEFERASPDRRAAAAVALRAAAAAFAGQLRTNPVAVLLDDNPFGVDVALRSTLGTALDEIIGSLPV